MPAVAERSIRIAIAKDAVRAHLIATDVDPRLINRQHIISSLQELGIPVSEDVMGRIKNIEELARTGKLSDQPILLVEGREPLEGTAARFELAPELLGGSAAGESDDDRVDFHRSQILTVAADAKIGTFSAEVPVTPGLNVYGKPVMVPAPLRSIQLGKNLQLAEDGKTVLSKVAGKIHLTNYQVTIVPVVEIKNDVDFSTGNVDAPADVLIDGTVRDSFQVKSAGSITVRGAIEAAEVQAGTDLQVNGGIASRGQGRVAAGGELFTKFCIDARIEAAGDITISREALNSNIRTQGSLGIARGKLIGGRVYARQGATLGHVGNEAEVKTIIAIGVDPLALAEAATAGEAIKKKLEAIQKIRQNVQPLMAQLKRLTPAQRERATELLYQADAMEQEVQEHEAKRAAALRQTAPDGREVFLFVQKIAYTGVSLIFGDRMATLHHERKGPFKVVRRVHNRVEEILLIDKISGSVTVLNSREYDAQAAQADFGG